VGSGGLARACVALIAEIVLDDHGPASRRDHYDRGVSERNLTVEARIPDALRPQVKDMLARAQQERVAERLRDGDATLWAPTTGSAGGARTPEVANRLGWLTIAERMLAGLGALELFVADAHDQGLEEIVLLGMGGSSLAPEVLRRAFAGIGSPPPLKSPPSPRLHVLDSTDAARVRTIASELDPESVGLRRNLFVVSSKSGGTIEPLSLFAHFYSLFENSNEFIAITDPGSGLEALAHEHGFLRTFPGDPDIGGRYSALSAFGIVPAALMGIGVRALLEGAAGAWKTPLSDDSGAVSEDCGVWLGAALSALARAGRDKLTFVISETLPGLGLWLEQLVAESTGKHGTGILPVADEPLGTPEVYGEDRVFAYLPDVGAPDAALDASVQALADAGHPVITMPTGGPTDLGRLFLLWELAVASAGWGLEINPFDQPNVQQAKDATKRVLADYEAKGELPSVPDADDAALRSLLLDAKPPQYVAIMSYSEPTPAFDEAAAELRTAIRAATRATTTFGYGPRFLHSTGQFHKGGPKTGRFLQLIHDGPDDVEIPGGAGGIHSFTTLKNAQAIGDLQTLRELGLPAERLRLAGDGAGGDPADALRALTAKITAARPTQESPEVVHANQ
jgi:transaldolase / glucose-6-phosphate isomerase